MYTLPQLAIYCIFHFILLRVGYSRYKTKVKVKNNLIELKGSKGPFTYDICLKIKNFKPPLL